MGGTTGRCKWLLKLGQTVELLKRPLLRKAEGEYRIKQKMPQMGGNVHNYNRLVLIMTSGPAI
jgi:hypothetical protein